MTKFWFSTGTLISWGYEFKNNVWGVERRDQLETNWEEASQDDIIFCYAKSTENTDRGRLVGVVKIIKRYEGTEKIWPGHFPLRFDFEVIYKVTPLANWQRQGIEIYPEYRGWMGSGIRPMRDKNKARRLYQLAKRSFE
jgi:hypothetical protein